MAGKADLRPGSLGRTGLRRVLATLCATEITSWGILYYAFPVLMTEISTTTGWSKTVLTAAFSAGQLAAAATGIPVGRWLDRHGPRAVMTAGSALAVAAAVTIGTAGHLAWFIVGWLAAGVAMGAVLYPPAFAALTHWYGERRVRALTILTLAGGLASTVFAPLTAWLTSQLGWRDTYLVLAAVLAVVTVPAHWWGLRGAWPSSERPALANRQDAPHRVLRSRQFIVLLVSLALAAFAGYAAVINTVPLLLERSISVGAASVALGLGGVGQVLGRLGYAALGRRTKASTRTAVILLASGFTTALLGLLTSTFALIGAVLLAGTARGMFTLLQATAVADRWGTAHYGRLTGVLSAPLAVTIALAPWVGTFLASVLGGFSPMFLVLACAAVVASALALGSATPTDRGSV
ncbi:MAG: MFS transporter [Kibdelosporangium sp.]